MTTMTEAAILISACAQFLVAVAQMLGLIWRRR